jgi:hypothetical protein
MDDIALLAAQLTDVFRIGLLAALIYTTERNRAQTGVAIPLLGGAGFVAVIIATTMPLPGVMLWRSIVSGFAANALILAPMWTAWKFMHARAK